MIRCTCFLSDRIILVFLLVVSSIAQTKNEYADWLYQQGDYFRAISEYKILQFFSKSADSANIFQYQIAKAYYKSGKHNKSIEEFTSLLERPISNELKSNCLNFIALNYLNLSLPNQALVYSMEALKIDTAKSSFTLGLIYANLYDWERAKHYFAEANKFSSSKSLSKLVNENLKILSSAPHINQKSPLLALLLSLIIPGAGQFYSEHYVDALQAFAFVGSFAYMSYISYRYDHSKDKGYYNFGISISITSLFYIANLIGAERTASYYNIKQRKDFLQRINEKSLFPFE